MIHRLIQRLIPAVVLLSTPICALAADDEAPNARLENYVKNVKTDPSSTAMSWLLLIVLMAMCVAVLFKNAKRTHLD